MEERRKPAGPQESRGTVAQGGMCREIALVACPVCSTAGQDKSNYAGWDRGRHRAIGARRG